MIGSIFNVFIFFTVISEVYGQTGTAVGSSIRYKPNQETVEFVEDPAMYDDVITVQQDTTAIVHDPTPAVNEGQEEYNYLSSATIGGLDEGEAYEDPVSTLSRVHISNQQNSVSYHSSPQQQVYE